MAIKKISTEFQLLDKFLDTSGDAGSANQVLVSTATGINWVDGSGSGIIGGPYLPLSAGLTVPLTGDLYLSDSKHLRFVTTGGLSGNASIDFSTGAALTFTVNSSNAPIIFKQSSTEWMRINASGNVGIGTTSPGAKLDVVGPTLGNTSGNTSIVAQFKAGRQYIDFKNFRTANENDWNDATFKIQARIDSTVHQSINFVNDASYNEHIDIYTGNQVFNTRFNANGNVGIGTTSPSEKLEVAGNIAIDQYLLHNGDLNTFFGFPGNDTASIGTNGSERMRITSTGNVGIGTSSPDRRLHVNSGGVDTVSLFESTDTLAKLEVKDDDTSSFIISENNESGFGPFGTRSTTGNLRINNGTHNGGGVGYAAFGGAPTTGTKFRVFSSYDTSGDANLSGVAIDINPTGTTALTADKTIRGLYVDIDSNATGGNTSDELRLYGIDSSTTDTGDADLIYSSYNAARSAMSVAGQQTTHLVGTRSIVQAYNTAGLISSAMGTYSTAAATGAGDINAIYAGRYELVGGTTDITIPQGYALYGRAEPGVGFTGTYNNIHAGYFEVESETGNTFTNSFGVKSIIDHNGGTMTNAYQFYGASSGTIGTSWGVYSTGAAKHYLSGDVGIGTTTPNYKLDVEGSANNAEIGIRINNTFDDNDPASEPNAVLFLNAASNNGYLRVHGAPANTAAKHQIDLGSSASSSFLTFSPGAAERMRIATDGAIQFNDYNLTNQTGTPTYLLGTDASGNVVKTNTVPGSGAGPYLPLAGGTIDGTLIIDTDTGSQPFYVTRSGVANQALKIYVDDAAAVFESIQDETADAYGSFIFKMDDGTTYPYFDIRKGNSTLARFDGNGNVGIGTTSPGAKLEVSKGSSGFTGSYNSRTAAVFEGSNSAGTTISIMSPSTGYSGLFFGDESGEAEGQIQYDHSASAFRFLNGGGSERMRITSDGNVGIGTTSPNAKLEVNSAITFSTLDTFGQLVVKAASGSTGDMLNIGVDTANSVAFIQAIERGVNTIPLSLQRYGGNVGIGTTSPDQKLHVKGGDIQTQDTTGLNGVLRIRATITGTPSTGGYPNVGAGDAVIEGGGTTQRQPGVITLMNGDSSISSGQDLGVIQFVGKDDATNGYASSQIIGTSAGTPGSGSSGGGILRFLTSPGSAGSTLQEAMRIGKTGNVGIGVTDPFWDLDVAGDIRIRDQGKLYFGNSGSIPYLQIYSDSNNNMVIDDVYLNNADVLFNIQGNIGMGKAIPTAKLDVVGDGRFTSTVTATNFILSSDKRLKNNVEEVSYNHIDVNWKTFETKSEKGQSRYGVIAQELEEVHPEFVRTDEQGMKSVAYIDLLIAKIAELEARLEKLEK